MLTIVAPRFLLTGVVYTMYFQFPLRGFASGMSPIVYPRMQ